MKAILLLSLLSVCSFSAHAQGRVNFSTYNFAPVTNLLTGQLIPSGSGWWAQLYYGSYGASDSQLIAVTNPPVHFAIDGYILTSTPYYTDPAIVAGGAFGSFQVRVWTADLGDNWDQAYNSWLSGPCCGILGKSNVGTIATANADAFPPAPPASLKGTGLGEIGIRPFYVGLPEPGVLALGLAGALALLWFRRWS